MPTIGEPNQEPWNTPTFLNSWLNFGSGLNPAGYWKDTLGVVHLRGTVKCTTPNTVIFNLPAGYRPPNRELFIVMSAGAGFATTMGRVDVLANGDVQQMLGGSEYLQLDGLTFRIA